MATVAQRLQDLRESERIDEFYRILESSRQMISGLRVEKIYVPPDLFPVLKGAHEYDPVWRGIRLAPSLHGSVGDYLWMQPLEYDISGDPYVYCNRDGDFVSINAPGTFGGVSVPILPVAPSVSSFDLTRNVTPPQPPSVQKLPTSKVSRVIRLRRERKTDGED